MPPLSGEPWKPTQLVRVARVVRTSMATAEVVTDAGPAYLKAMGNPEGPHALACELAGTKLAQWFGLPTLDFTLIDLDEADVFAFPGSGEAQPGPAFVTRREPGRQWSGAANDLKRLDNPGDVGRLVVFDTWTRNPDRHPPEDSGRSPNLDNVFLSERETDPGRYRLLAIDHQQCFTSGQDLTPPVATIDRVKDERVYGLFPEFIRHVRKDDVRDATERLGAIDEPTCREIVDSVPDAWEVSAEARRGLVDLILNRAAFVADRIMDRLAPHCWPQGELPFSD